MLRVVSKDVAEVNRCRVVGSKIFDLRLVGAKHGSPYLLISSPGLFENGTAIGRSTSSSAALLCRHVIRVPNF